MQHISENVTEMCCVWEKNNVVTIICVPKCVCVCVCVCDSAKLKVKIIYTKTPFYCIVLWHMGLTMFSKLMMSLPHFLFHTHTHTHSNACLNFLLLYVQMFTVENGMYKATEDGTLVSYGVQ